MEATIRVGTELKSGKVIDILNDGVVVQKGENAHKISFEQAEKEVQWLRPTSELVVLLTLGIRSMEDTRPFGMLLVL